jgi:predicted nucleic acid-binding protein
LIDEKASRNLDKNFFLTPLGTIGILRLAKFHKKIDKIKPYLDSLIGEFFDENTKEKSF